MDEFKSSRRMVENNPIHSAMLVLLKSDKWEAEKNNRYKNKLEFLISCKIKKTVHAKWKFKLNFNVFHPEMSSMYVIKSQMTYLSWQANKC